MPHSATTEDLFFTRTGLDGERAMRIVGDALAGADDGELYLEYRQSESISLDDGRIKSASFDTAQGFGLRAVSGEATGYAHASELSEEALLRAADTVRAVRSGHSGSLAVGPVGTNRSLYTDLNPLALVPFGQRLVAGGAHPSPRRHPCLGHPPAGAHQCDGDDGPGRPHGNRQPWLGRPGRL